MDNLNENTEIIEESTDNVEETKEEKTAVEEAEKQEEQITIETDAEAVEKALANGDGDFAEVKEEETKPEDAPKAPEFVRIGLDILNRYQLMLIMNSLKIYDLIQKQFLLVTLDKYVKEKDEEGNVKAVYADAELFLLKPDEEKEEQMIVMDVIDSELAIQDGNGMDVSIKPFDKVYVKDMNRNVAFKGVVIGYGYNYDEQDVEIDLVISFNGRLDIVKFMYSDETSKLFSRGTNIGAAARDFIKFIEE